VAYRSEVAASVQWRWRGVYTGDEINIGVKRRIIIVQPTRAAADGVNLKREPDKFRLGYYLRWNNFRICHRTAEETLSVGAFACIMYTTRLKLQQLRRRRRRRRPEVGEKEAERVGYREIYR